MLFRSVVKLDIVQIKDEAKKGMDRGESPLSRWEGNMTHSSRRGRGDISAIGTRQGQCSSFRMKPMLARRLSSLRVIEESIHGRPPSPDARRSTEFAMRAKDARAWICAEEGGSKGVGMLKNERADDYVNTGG